MQILPLYSSLYCFQGSVGPEASSNSALKDQEAIYINSEEQVQALSVRIQTSQSSLHLCDRPQFYRHSWYHFTRSKPRQSLWYFMTVSLPTCSDPAQISSRVSLYSSCHKHCPFPFTSSSNLIPPVHVFILLMVSVTTVTYSTTVVCVSLIYNYTIGICWLPVRPCCWLWNFMVQNYWSTKQVTMYSSIPGRSVALWVLWVCVHIDHRGNDGDQHSFTFIALSSGCFIGHFAQD